MTKEEARKKADEYALKSLSEVEQLLTKDEYEDYHKRAVDAYLQCFHDMTSGEPDGWCAKHSKLGVQRFSSSGIFVGDTFEDALDELKNDYNLDYEYGDYMTSEKEKDNPNRMTYTQWLSAQGWRIVPVKLLVMEDKTNE